VLLTMNGATVQSARVVMGAVAPVPWRSTAAEQALAGKGRHRGDRGGGGGRGAAGCAAAQPERLQDPGREGTAVKRAILRAAGIQTV
jgi:xanthine dehydrogenase YagS FAD-binding subunit